MIQAGQYITDGTCVWIIDDIRDGDRVGDISLRPTLRDGHILADRSVVVASEYPRLVAFVVANNLVTTDSTDVSKYLYDSENDTLTVPDMTGRVLQGGNAVEAKAAGLPNITGGLSIGYVTGFVSGTFSGAFEAGSGTPRGGASTTDSSACSFARFNASKSNSIYSDSVNTVQPPAIEYLPQIKY